MGVAYPRSLAGSPLTAVASESVNVGSIGALESSSAWLAEATPPHLAVQGRRNDSLNNLPDVGVRETQEPHSLTETLSKISPAIRLRLFANVGLPTVARSASPVARLRQGYGGPPPPVFMSGGWWRIPGSNR